MAVVAMLTAAVAPGIALLAYFYLKDRYDSEPLSMVAKMFILGVLIVFPTMVIQRGIVLGVGENHWISSFLVSGMVEEFVKWFIIYHMVYSHRVFDEPYDGIVYAVAVSIGFATLENVIYTWYNHANMIEFLVRAMLPVSGHALFGVMMGYYLGRAKFSPLNKYKYIGLSLFMPMLWHGVFDYILSVIRPFWIWLILPFMLTLWIKGMRSVNRANARSPFRTLQQGQD